MTADRGIVLKNINKAFDGRQVLTDVCLDLPSHGLVSINGSSGSGKTTLINIIMGLLKPDSGLVSGNSLTGMAVVFQEDRLLPWYDLFENILFVCRDKALCEKWIDAMELSDDVRKYPEELSGGMKRRVAIARAMVCFEERSGSLLILDEPFKGLDDDLRKRVIDKVIPLAVKQALVVLISHDKEDCEYISNFMTKVDEMQINNLEVVYYA